jgi:hypothetical protein
MIFIILISLFIAILLAFDRLVSFGGRVIEIIQEVEAGERLR